MNKLPNHTKIRFVIEYVDWETQHIVGLPIGVKNKVRCVTLNYFVLMKKIKKQDNKFIGDRNKHKLTLDCCQNKLLIDLIEVILK